MKKTISLENLVNDPGCLSEYDPNAMKIEVARKYIHNFLKTNTVKLKKLRLTQTIFQKKIL